MNGASRTSGGLALALLAALVAAAPPACSQETFVAGAAERAQIEHAAPAQAPARPAKPRRLLIFTLNVGYGGHPSIAHANEAFAVMGRKTGAFATVVTNDPAVFARDSLARFDAVFFNNTVGNCFTNEQWRENLLAFVAAGGGLMGVHGTSVAFTRWPGAVEDWPEFGLLLGARGAAHKESDERVWIKLDDPGHPLNRVFGGQGFEYRDEFFRFGAPYSRQRVRVLLSIDTARTDLRAGQARGEVFRADQDYALAWVRRYGRGRVFYSTIAHNPRVFWDAKMLEFYLAAAQFVLGDLSAPTTPSGRLTPAARAQETLGWRLGLEADNSGSRPLFEQLDRAAALGLSHIGASSAQVVGADIRKPFDPLLSDEEVRQIRRKLDEAAVQLTTYQVHEWPEDEPACRRLFDFARKLGIETFIAAPRLETLDRLERLCEAYDVNIALRGGAAQTGVACLHPRDVLKTCAGRGRHLGGWGDLDAWRLMGVNPRQAARLLKDRLLAVRLPTGQPPNARGATPARNPAGLEEFLRELRRQGIQPTLFGVTESAEADTAPPRLPPAIEQFNNLSLKLAK